MRELERALRLAPPPDAVSVELEVPFHDADMLRVAWHGHYFKYFEIARQALQRRHRVDAPDLAALGVHWYVVDSRVRHVAPLRYGDRFGVRAWFFETDPRIGIAYEVRRLADGAKIARAATVLVNTRPDGELLFEAPAAVLERIRRG